MNKQIKNIKLLSCPFCGGEARGDNAEVYCLECGASIAQTDEDAITQWNRRKPVVAYKE